MQLVRHGVGRPIKNYIAQPVTLPAMIILFVVSYLVASTIVLKSTTGWVTALSDPEITKLIMILCPAPSSDTVFIIQ